MSMMNVHKDALNAGGEVYHEFLLRFRKEHKTVYGIVEGKDDPLFYRGLIEQNLPSGWDVDLLVAGNRSKVLRAEEDFDWNRFPRSRICFFVDRDLSDFSKVEEKVFRNIYVTDKYSIENELANFGTIKRVMHEILNINEISHGELILMGRNFEDNIRIFSNNMTSIMAQIIIWQRQGGKPSLDNICPKDIFEFDNGKIKMKGDFDILENRIGYAAKKVNLVPSSPAELTTTTEEFIRKSGPERLIRGKYITWFVVEQCLHFHNRIQNYCKSYMAPPKVRVTLGQANAMTLVATRIRCPDSLDNFIKSTYCEYTVEPQNMPQDVPDEKDKNEKRLFRRVTNFIYHILEKIFRGRIPS